MIFRNLNCNLASFKGNTDLFAYVKASLGKKDFFITGPSYPTYAAINDLKKPVTKTINTAVNLAATFRKANLTSLFTLHPEQPENIFIYKIYPAL